MEKEKPTKCPKCQQYTLYHNKGISKAGNPYENYKCKCGHLEWVPMDQADQNGNSGKNADIIVKIQSIQDAQRIILDAISELKSLLS